MSALTPIAISQPTRESAQNIDIKPKKQKGDDYEKKHGKCRQNGSISRSRCDCDSVFYECNLRNLGNCVTGPGWRICAYEFYQFLPTIRPF